MMTDRQELARLRWRCRRGLLELDLLFERFLSEQYNLLTSDEKESFSRLLDIPDTTLMAYLNRSQKCPDLNLQQIIRKI
ncbi:MAG: hypothetical protein BMS9Abin33_0754 [Gammaproteobacteria bacterium]|nr:MAG: hypothetical protein BMS9Abin33_0754 [Gammaproteobacteria bacterium]